jgi:hypothetical protein
VVEAKHLWGVGAVGGRFGCFDGSYIVGPAGRTREREEPARAVGNLKGVRSVANAITIRQSLRSGRSPSAAAPSMPPGRRGAWPG